MPFADFCSLIDPIARISVVISRQRADLPK